MIRTAAALDEMTRGGRRRMRAAPERRCIATGESAGAERMIRFVLSPDGEAVPDLAARLPGRGVWLTADRVLAERAVTKRLFSRGFRAKATVAEDLPDLLERLLVERMVAILGFARKAGQAVTGAEKVRARIGSGAAGLLIQARDGAPGGRQKLAALAEGAGSGRVGRSDLLDSAELGLAFGRDFAIHAALDGGGFAARFAAEARRLSGFRDAPPDRATARDDAACAGRGPARQTGADTPDERHSNDRQEPVGSARQDDP